MGAPASSIRGWGGGNNGATVALHSNAGHGKNIVLQCSFEAVATQ